MNWKKIYKNVVENICKKQIDPQKNIYEPEPPKAFLEGRTYTENSNYFINIFLDEFLATEEDYKDYCRFVFEKIGESLEDYLQEDKKFLNFKKSN